MNIRIQNGFEDRPINWMPNVSIIIDVFRASTTTLAILEKRPTEYLIVNELDLIKDLLENSYRLISEVYDLGIDNSPTLVRQYLSSEEKVVHTTTNLTTALEKNYLNMPMLICCFNNIETVVKHLIESNYSNIEIIAAGKMKTQKEAPEDTLCAKMLANKLKNGMFGVLVSRDSLLANLEEKKVQLSWPRHYVDDIKHAIQLNLSDVIPMVQRIRPNLFQVSTL